MRKPDCYNLFRLLKTIVEVYRIAGNQQNTVIRLYFDKSLPQVYKGNEDKVRQVVNNLVSNAVLLSQNGQVQVKALFNKVKGAEVDVQIEVISNGTGIKKENTAKILEEFTQEESNSLLRYEDPGSGLSVTKQLLSQMGSHINIDSHPDHGSKFSFSLLLPIGDEGLDVQKEAEQKDQKELPLRALIVEDNKVNIKIAENFLGRMGIQTVNASNGMIAVGLVDEMNFDIIYMDLQMPVMDGLQATKLIRKVAGYEKTPIIGLSASVLENDKNEAKKAGMNDYIKKPFYYDDFYSKTLKALDVGFQGKWVGMTGPMKDGSGEGHDFEKIIAGLIVGGPQKEKEFAGAVIRNMEELCEMTLQAIDENSGELLENIRHKSRTSIRMLQLETLSNLLDSLQEQLPYDKQKTKIISKLYYNIKRECESVIVSLRKLEDEQRKNINH